MYFQSGILVEAAAAAKTACETDKTALKEDNLVLVTNVKEIVSYQGKRIPSSETFLHKEIYKKFPRVQVILHPHCKYLTENASLEHLRTKKFVPYGTKDLAQEILPILKESDIAILRHHGEIIIGKSFEEAFAILENTVRKIKTHHP